MRRTTPRQRRLPAPRAVLIPRSRFAPLALALPLVLGLWLTIGLPILAELSSATGGNGSLRDFRLDAEASGNSGGGRGSTAWLVAAAVVDPGIVREVRLERLQERTVVHATRPGRARRTKPVREARPRLVSRTQPPGVPTSPLGAAVSSIASPPPPPALRPSLHLRPRPHPSPLPRLRRNRLLHLRRRLHLPGTATPAPGASATAAPGSAGACRRGHGRPRPGGPPETGDEILLTFSGAVDPALILAGWDGSATAVTLHIEGPARNDVLTVLDPSDGSVLGELGSVQTSRDYADSADFTGSLMTLGGDTVTIVLGTVTGTTRRDPAAKELVWTTPQGTATESGRPDSDF